MNNLSIVQEAWLASGARFADDDINLQTVSAGFVTVAFPEPGYPGYCVMSLTRGIQTFDSFGDAMDFIAAL